MIKYGIKIFWSDGSSNWVTQTSGRQFKFEYEKPAKLYDDVEYALANTRQMFGYSTAVIALDLSRLDEFEYSNPSKQDEYYDNCIRRENLQETIKKYNEEN